MAPRNGGSRATVRSAGSHLLLVAAVAVAYLIGARLGLQLAFANRNVTAVWPPTGIAVAALLLFGLGALPGVAIGGFLANLTNGAGLEAAALITVGNTLAPLAAGLLLTRVLAMRHDLARVRDVTALVVAGLVSMTISATLGTVALLVSGGLSPADYGATWTTWWIGDSMGVVLFAPFLLLVATTRPMPRPTRAQGLEAAILLLVLVGASAGAFISHFPLTYLIFPPVIWAAVRFSRLGAATTVVIVSSIAIAATVRGGGPYVASLSVTGSLIALQALNGCVALIALVLAAVTDQARAARSALEHLTADLEAQVEERTAELRASNQAKTEFLSRVSHELRTPLTAIIGYADLLQLDETREPQLAKLDALTRASEHLLALVEDILDISHIDSGRQALHIEQVPLHAVIAEALELVAIEARRRGIVIRTIGVEKSTMSVSADRFRLRQALINLLTNAIKYSPVDGAVSISIRPVTGARTRVIVTDSGPGISAEFLPRLFQPFDRLGEERTGVPGTGLGLALYRRIVESMGGAIGVESVVGSGSSFWFELGSPAATRQNASAAMRPANVTSVTKTLEGTSAQYKNASQFQV
ncbi:MAG: MASE1 domain-containing protein [Candidatus Dormiibacterota bacterium]